MGYSVDIRALVYFVFYFFLLASPQTLPNCSWLYKLPDIHIHVTACRLVVQIYRDFILINFPPNCSSLQTFVLEYCQMRETFLNEGEICPIC